MACGYREGTRATSVTARLSTGNAACTQTQSCNAALQLTPQSPTSMVAGHESKGMGMNEPQDSAALERNEIAMRVASFKATQEKFARERDEYFVATLRNARLENKRGGPRRPPFR
jgi:hypothetical protein